MEVILPSQPLQSDEHRFAHCHRLGSQSTPPENPRHASEKIYVAVGRSTEKSARLLAWAVRHFECEQIWLLHVHRPSPTIPTPLGRFPVSQVNDEAVSAYRREELKVTKRLLHNYLSICNKAQVRARIISTESESVQKGIDDLVNRHGIRILVIGSSSDNCLRMTMGSKDSYVMKKLAPSCEVWFVSKGSHAWTREASEECSLATGSGSCECSSCSSGDELDRKENGGSACASKASCASEVRRKEEVEEAIRAALRERERLSQERDKALRDYDHALREICAVEDSAREVRQRREEVALEVRSALSSVVNLKLERYLIRRQSEEADYRHGLIEFSLSELESGTCNFSDSFRVGQGASSCLYKGELLGATVVIKKLHPHDRRGQLGFHTEADALGKLKHPHIVNLIGICPDAWCLVYEYLPNGSLRDHLAGRASAALQWMDRARMAAEICSALLFLHSCMPEKIIHGGVRAENIYLDNQLRSKLGGFSFCGAATEKHMRRISFGSSAEVKEGFPYSDPGDCVAGGPTAKSDVYALGIIVLQLLTGRPPSGLASEVRQAVLRGALSSILDQTAGNWPPSVATKLAEFGLLCSETKAQDRPELAPEVLRELVQLLTPEARPVPSFFLCPIRQEIMKEPVVAADGHTYDGAALRGWLDVGRNTSPMTNLRLDHLKLTPNHALRLAIHAWLTNFR